MAQAKTAQGKGEIDLDAQKKKPAGNKKQLMLYILIGSLIAGLGATTFLLLKKDEKHGGEPKVEAKATNYVAFKPFIVNFSQKGPARFLQVELQVSVSSPEVVKAMEVHHPAIRNDVNLLLAAQTFETASTREGKEKLREEIKAAMQKILDEQRVTGSVDAVYFTSFVMQ